MVRTIFLFHQALTELSVFLVQKIFNASSEVENMRDKNSQIETIC